MDKFDEAVDEVEHKFKSDYQEQKDRRWEINVVKKVCSHFDIKYKELQNLVRGKTGLTDVYFSHLINHTSPAFPVWLSCEKIPYVFQTTIEDIFKKAERCIMVKRFLQVADSVPDVYVNNDIRGLVFEWLHSGGSHKILHTCDYRSPYKPNSELDVQIRIHTPDKTYTLENLNVFLDRLNWEKPHVC